MIICLNAACSALHASLKQRAEGKKKGKCPIDALAEVGGALEALAAALVFALAFDLAFFFALGASSSSSSNSPILLCDIMQQIWQSRGEASQAKS